VEFDEYYTSSKFTNVRLFQPCRCGFGYVDNNGAPILRGKIPVYRLTIHNEKIKKHRTVVEERARQIVQKVLGRAVLIDDDGGDRGMTAKIRFAFQIEGKLLQGDLMNEFILESEMVEKISTRLSRHIVPLFINGVDGKPRPCGSGFLVSVGAVSFLVSAAHVFDELKTGNELYFYVEPKTIRKLSASGRILVTKILRAQAPPEARGRTIAIE
jgi:hypothetical protein